MKEKTTKTRNMITRSNQKIGGSAMKKQMLGLFLASAVCMGEAPSAVAHMPLSAASCPLHSCPL